VLRQMPRQRPRPGRSAITITAAVAAAAAFLPAFATSASAQVPARLATASLASRVLRSAATPLLLINGDRFTLRTTRAGGTAAAFAAHDGDPIWTLRLGHATYYIPAQAIPYLGRGLDPSLFDLQSLQRLESGGRLPVTVSYAGATPAIPGITITRARGGTAAGYLTAASAKLFGAALARQFAAGHASGGYGAAGMFAGLNIGLAGTTVSTPVRPQFPMHTLTVTASNEFGKPDSGDEVLLINADNPGKFGDPNEVFNVFYHGSAKYSVPAGHYWALAGFFGLLKNTVSERMVLLPQFTVSGTSSRVHVSATAANSLVTFKTTRPATLDTSNWTILRTSGNHELAGSGTVQFFGPLWISPTTTKPTVGSLQSITGGELLSPAKSPPYTYNLTFTGPQGIVPAQQFVVTPASLATVHELMWSGGRSTEGFLLSIGGSVYQNSAAFAAGIKVPGTEVQYFSGGKSYFWESQFGTENGAGQSDTPHVLLAGQNLTENWNEYPLHPQPDFQLMHGSLADDFPALPSAFRTGNEIWFVPNAFSDNDTQFGHFGESFYTGGYEIQQDGKRVAGGGWNGYARAKLSGQPSVVKFSLNTTQQPNPLSVLSPSTDTVWTMHTVAAPHAVVPASWECANIEFNPTQHCSVPPMLTLNYQVTGIGLNGVAPAGSQVIAVSVGHIQLSQASAIVSAKAQVSWDGGLFWEPATVTRTSAGLYRVSFTPPAGVNVTLRFTAADAAGGSISETITDAYAVGPAA
jgi:hypothetical protein